MNIQLCRTGCTVCSSPTLICAGPAQKQLDYTSPSVLPRGLQALATDRFKLGCCRFLPYRVRSLTWTRCTSTAASLKTLLATFRLTPRNGVFRSVGMGVFRSRSVSGTVQRHRRRPDLDGDGPARRATASPLPRCGYPATRFLMNPHARWPGSPAHIAAIGTIGKALGKTWRSSDSDRTRRRPSPSPSGSSFCWS